MHKTHQKQTKTYENVQIAQAEELKSSTDNVVCIGCGEWAHPLVLLPSVKCAVQTVKNLSIPTDFCFTPS